MRALWIALSLALLPLPLFADTPRELLVDHSLLGALATSADVTDGTDPSSSQAARLAADADADVRLTIPELHLGDPWIKPVIGVGAGVDADVIGALCDGCDAERSIDLQGEAEARVHALWGNYAFYRETYQRPVSFRDGFWRNERGLIRRTIGLHAQLLGLDQPEEYTMDLFAFDWERRELFQAELGNYFSPSARLGHEHHFSFAMARGEIFSDEFAFQLHFVEFGMGRYIVPPPTDTLETNVFPLFITPEEGSIEAMELDVTVLDLRILGPEGTLRVEFGMASRRPASVGDFYTAESSGGASYAIGYGQALARDHVPGWERFGERRPRYRSVGWLVQIEDFRRIDATGLAVDAGHQLSGDVAWGINDAMVLSSSVALVGTRRDMISELRAPEAELLAEVGDYLVMGRVEAQFDWELHPMFSLTSNLWFERSDRADPLRPAIHRALIPLDTNAGAWVGLSFHVQ